MQFISNFYNIWTIRTYTLQKINIYEKKLSAFGGRLFNHFGYTHSHTKHKTHKYDEILKNIEENWNDPHDIR